MIKEKRQLTKACKQLSEALLKLIALTPEDFKLEAWMENEEIVIEIKKKGEESNV